MIRKIKNLRRRKQSRAAVAAVEFAVVAPLLLLLVFMMIESSRYLTSLHATTGAAREVVRMASVTGADQAAMVQVAKTFMEQSSFTSNTVAVTVTTDDSVVPGMVSFTAVVTIEFDEVSVIGDPFDLGVNLVRGSSTMLAPE